MDLARAASLALVILASAPVLTAGDPPRREPSSGAAPLQVFAWSSGGGLRYTWVLPEEYDGKTPRNLTVILHGTGLDYRWGHEHNGPGILRPDDVVVSVDGTSPGEGDSRLFLGKEADAGALRVFLEELRATFAVDRIYLYGHGQGGLFALYYAGQFPETVSGVVAHASGVWSWSQQPPLLKKVALAFLHGTADPVVPYVQSREARDRFATQGLALVHLRRLDRYDHGPNAVRATETLDWCQGMTARTPGEALECARRILRKKPPDEFNWETLVDYSGARAVLRRLEGKGPVPFEDVPPAIESDARRWIDAIEEAGAEHVSAIRKGLGTQGLALDGRAWLGQLLPLREDFRGVGRVEAFVKELGLDRRRAQHERAAAAIWKAWNEESAPEPVVEAIATTIGQAFLVDGLPPGLAEKMEEWRAQDLALSPEARKKLADFEAWRAGWAEGLENYEKLWRKWKGPEE